MKMGTGRISGGTLIRIRDNFEAEKDGPAKKNFCGVIPLICFIKSILRKSDFCESSIFTILISVLQQSFLVFTSHLLHTSSTFWLMEASSFMQ